jgi:sec-independent protein translocase protein TatB
VDGIFGIGPLELILIAVLALIVLGPERLPGVMREGAKYMRRMRRMGNELTSQFSEELKMLDEINPRKILNEMTDPDQPEPGENPPAKAAPPTVKAPASPVTKATPQSNGAPGTTPKAPVSSSAAIAKASGMPASPAAASKSASNTPAASPATPEAETNAADDIVANTILPPERTIPAPPPATQDGAESPDAAPESTA